MEYENKVFKMDCNEFMKQLPEASVDFCIADFPYNISNFKNSVTKKGNNYTSGDFGDWDKWDTQEEFLNWVFLTCTNIKRILRPNASCLFFFANKQAGWIAYELERRSLFVYKSPIIFMKKNPLPHLRKTGFRSAFEHGLWMINSEESYIDSYGAVVKPRTFNFLEQKEMCNVMGYSIGKKETCVHGDTLVLTTKGFLPIKEIKQGDFVMSLSGNFNKVLKTHRKFSVDNCKIKINGINKRLICTANHKIYTNENSSHRLVIKGEYRGMASSCSQRFIQARNLYPRFRTCNSWFTQSTVYPKIPTVKLYNQDLLKFYGLYLAEGFVNGNDKVINFVFNKKEIKIIDELGKIIKNLYNKDIKIFQKKDCDNALLVYFCSKRIASELVSLFGRGAIEKSLPVEFLSLDKDSAFTLFKYYCMGDGWFNHKRNSYIVSSASYNLLLGFHILLENNNIGSHIVSSKSGGGKINGRRNKAGTGYKLITTLKERKFRHQVKSNVPLKEKIKVYDLTIENEHNYLTEFGIVHNCHPTEKPYELINRFIRIFTNEGDLVIDPFMGSGCTAVECIKLGRKFTGTEISPEFHNMLSYRIEYELTQQNLF